MQLPFSYNITIEGLETDCVGNTASAKATKLMYEKVFKDIKDGKPFEISGGEAEATGQICLSTASGQIYANKIAVSLTK